MTAFSEYKPGTFCWNELMTTDVDKAGAFYTKLFGYTADTQNMGGVDYTSLINGDRPAGGMMALTPEMGEGIPSNWSVYLAVADCDAIAEKAIALGGKVCKEPEDIPGIGRFAVIADPQGAVFCVIKLENQPE
jgi:predicted enzyme related to lactoylglutathione lyase